MLVYIKQYKIRLSDNNFEYFLIIDINHLPIIKWLSANTDKSIINNNSIIKLEKKVSMK